jgi:hypothetical protein
MGSPCSSFRNNRLRWLYRKQYFTPTIILYCEFQSEPLYSQHSFELSESIGLAYHKFVKTTPNPRATKKSSGELLGPPPPPELPVEVLDGAVVVLVEVVEDMFWLFCGGDGQWAISCKFGRRA